MNLPWKHGWTRCTEPSRLVVRGAATDAMRTRAVGKIHPFGMRCLDTSCCEAHRFVPSFWVPRMAYANAAGKERSDDQRGAFPGRADRNGGVFAA